MSIASDTQRLIVFLYPVPARNMRFVAVILTMIAFALLTTPQPARAHGVQLECEENYGGDADDPLQIDAKLIDQIIEEIRSGCSLFVEFAEIQGPFEFISDADVTNVVTFLDSTFTGEVTLAEFNVANQAVISFNNVVFEKPVLIDGLRSEGEVFLEMGNSTFNDSLRVVRTSSVGIDLSNATINETFYLQNIDTARLFAEAAIFSTTVVENIEKSLTVEGLGVVFRGPLRFSEIADARLNFGPIDRNRPLVAAAEGAVFQGTVSAVNVEKLELIVPRAVFERDVFIVGVMGANLNFSRATFDKLLRMDHIDRASLNFKAVRAPDSIEFSTVTLSDPDFSASVINGFSWDNVTINGGMLPPARIDTITSGLDWVDVQRNQPASMERSEFLERWETIYAGAGHASNARQPRTALRRLEVTRFGKKLGYSVGLGLVLLTTAYGGWFAKLDRVPIRRSQRLRWLWNVIEFTVDISTPGLDPPGHDWRAKRPETGVGPVSASGPSSGSVENDNVREDYLGLPVENIPSIVLIGNRFAGWVALTLGGALIVAYFIA